MRLRIRHLAALVAAALVVSVVVAVDDVTSPTADAAEEVLPVSSVDGVIAFACFEETGYDICVTNPATGAFVNVTETAGIHETDPSWSPDGRKIIAASWSVGGTSQLDTPADAELVTIDVGDLTDPGPIRSTGIRGFAPAWGPDGNLAYARYIGDEGPFHNRYPIEVMFARYSEIWERFENPGMAISRGGNMWSDPSWAPDGKRVIASFRKGVPPDVQGVSWGELVRLPLVAPPAPGWLNLVAGPISGPEVAEKRRSGNGYLEGDVNPDGNLIAHVQCSVLQLNGKCASASRRLAVMSINGVDEPGLATLTEAGENARSPEWSPDGGTIVYGSAMGIRTYDATSGERSSVAGSGAGDMQPSWRPLPDFGDGAFIADDEGVSKRAFTEAANVNVVALVPTTATTVRACIFDAAALELPLTPDVGCREQFAPAPFRTEELAATGETATVGFGSLPPGRYRALVEFDGAAERRTTNVFTVTCFGGTCDVFPRLAIAASLENFANTLDTLSLALEAACTAMLYTQQVLSASRTFTTALASGNSVRAITQLALNAEMNYLTGKGVELSAVIIQSRFTKTIVGGAIDGGKTYNDNIAAREKANENYFNATDAGDKVTRRDQATEADRQVRSGLKKGAGKMFVGLAKDKIFDRYPSVRQAYENVQALRQAPFCGVFRQQNGALAAAARALAAELRSNSTVAPMRLAQLDAALEGSDTAIHAFAQQLTTDSEPPPGSYLPDTVDTDRALLSIISALDAVSNVIDDTAPLIADPDDIDAVGALTASLDGYGAWSALLPSLGEEVRRVSLIDGRSTDQPLASAQNVAEVERAQQFLRDNPLTPDERQDLIDQGATDDLIDEAVAEFDQFDISVLTTTTAADVDDGLTAVAADMAAITAELSTNLRDLRAGLSPAPIVEDATAITEVDVAATISPPVFDPQGDFVDVELASPPTNGDVTPSLDSFVYVPAPGFTGTDSFTYRATDGTNISGVKTITVEVKLPAPSPAPDSYGLRQGEVLTIPAPGVLTNDSSPRIPLSAEMVTPATNGVVELSADGALTIRSDRVGVATFTYRASYPGSAPSEPVTVTIDVVAQQSPPVASPDVVSTMEDTPVVVSPLANDGDPDGDAVTLVGVTRPAHGTVRCVVAECTYAPADNFAGVDEFRYTVADGTGRRSLGIITVTVAPVDDAPIAAPDLLSFDAGLPGTVDVLANDSHPDGSALTFEAATGTTNGTLVCTSAGVCTYTPNDATIVADEATYTVRDERGTVVQGTITIRRFAAFEEIAATGPLAYIVTGSSLSCAVDYGSDVLGAFFADFGCGTFATTDGTLYGPQVISGSGNPPQPRSTFTRTSQTGVSGTGSVDDPYSMTTTVQVGGTGLSLIQHDRYVDGEESYLTEFDVVNNSDSPRSLTLYRAGDCVVADGDEGLSTLDPVTGAATCTATTGDRIIRWTPLSPDSGAFSGGVDDMWAAIASQTPFADQCRCDETTPFDNAAGLSWTIDLAPGASTTRSLRTEFAPFAYDPLTIDVTADAATASVNAAGGYTVTVTNPNTTTPVNVGELAVELPPDFIHTPGSTSGDTTNDPSTLDGTLRWTSPFELPAGGSRSVHIDVTTGPLAGTFTTSATAHATIPATPSGPQAPITLSDNMAPSARPTVTSALLTATLDGSASFDPDGTIVSWNWDFGDGASGSGDIVPHTYAAPGTYQAALTVVDDLGASTMATIAVEVSDPNLAPTARISGTPAPGAVVALLAAPVQLGVPIFFDGTESVDLDGTIVNWIWDFGDANTGSGPTVTHTYDTVGSKTVVLTVTDDRGETGVATDVVVVVELANLDPIADFTYATSGLTATLDGGASTDEDGPGGQPVVWEWSFGDGATGSGIVVDHVYATDGEYEVTLTVTDDRGASDTHTNTVGVGTFANEPPVAAAAPEGSGLIVDLDGSSSSDGDGEIAFYEWDFGDESSSAGPQPRHTFAAPGTYRVTLLVSDNDGALDQVSLDLVLPLKPSATSTTSTSTTSTSTTSTSTTPTSTTSTSTTSTSTTSTSTTPTTMPTTASGTAVTSTQATTSTSESTATTTTIALPMPDLPAAQPPFAATTAPLPPLQTQLPQTGNDLGATLRLIVLLVAAGAALIAVTRRSRPQQSSGR